MLHFIVTCNSTTQSGRKITPLTYSSQISNTVGGNQTNQTSSTRRISVGKRRRYFSDMYEICKVVIFDILFAQFRKHYPKRSKICTYRHIKRETKRHSLLENRTAFTITFAWKVFLSFPKTPTDHFCTQQCQKSRCGHLARHSCRDGRWAGCPASLILKHCRTLWPKLR